MFELRSVFFFLAEAAWFLQLCWVSNEDLSLQTPGNVLTTPNITVFSWMETGKLLKINVQ